ncbi:MAG: UDP-N-acetylglucosamine 1-carboxyvinyltransferase, partial [Patescibacteria group bacterium]
DLEIINCRPEHLESLIIQLESAGVEVRRGDTWLKISRPKKIRAASITTAVYPGFATDLQSPFAVLLTQAEGESKVFETVFEGRLHYLEELRRMGANVIPCDPHRAIIIGPNKLRGRMMESPDLRAGLAFVIAALIAEGQSEIHNVFHIDRGYAQIEKRLQAVGAKIERVT